MLDIFGRSARRLPGVTQRVRYGVGWRRVGHYHPSGYLYQEGGVVSPDGHCRAFDEKAKGTLSGKRPRHCRAETPEDAMRDGDQIEAVIRGSAINNDGAAKVGYTAPSVEGQAAVIAEAQTIAGVTADSISYVEAHGTATPLGDPIEAAALTQGVSSRSNEATVRSDL